MGAVTRVDCSPRLSDEPGQSSIEGPGEARTSHMSEVAAARSSSKQKGAVRSVSFARLGSRHPTWPTEFIGTERCTLKNAAALTERSQIRPPNIPANVNTIMLNYVDHNAIIHPVVTQTHGSRPQPGANSGAEPLQFLPCVNTLETRVTPVCTEKRMVGEKSQTLQFIGCRRKLASQTKAKHVLLFSASLPRQTC